MSDDRIRYATVSLPGEDFEQVARRTQRILLRTVKDPDATPLDRSIAEALLGYRARGELRIRLK